MTLGSASSSRVRRARFIPQSLVWFAVYLMLTLCLLRGALRTPTETVPAGYTRVATVQMLNMWTIWWNGQQLRAGFQHYWDAPIFFPTAGALAFSEPQPITLILAPIYWLTESLPATYNVWLITGLTLDGWCSYRFLKLLRLHDFLAGCGGMTCVLLPAVYPQFDAVQIVHFCPQIWTLTAIYRMLQQPRVSAGIVTGVAFATCFLVSIHQGLLFAMLLAGSGWILLLFASRAVVAPVACAITVAAFIVGPLAYGMNQQMRPHGFERSARTMAANSAVARDFLVLPGPLMPAAKFRHGDALCPGIARCSLALIGLYGIRRRRHRKWRLFIGAFGVLATLLALGPHFRVFDFQPWIALSNSVAFVSKIRNLRRFAIFAQVAVVCLAFIGLNDLLVMLRRGPKFFVRGLLVQFCAIVAVAEVLPPVIPTVSIPDVAGREWGATLRRLSSVDEGVWCIPMSAGPNVSQMETEAAWMFAATHHEREIVNGYSGFFPDEYLETALGFNNQGLTSSRLSRLRFAGVRWIVVRAHAFLNVVSLFCWTWPPRFQPAILGLICIVFTVACSVSGVAAKRRSGAERFRGLHFFWGRKVTMRSGLVSSRAPPMRSMQ